MDAPDLPAEDAPRPIEGTGPLDVLLIEGSPEDAHRFEECLRDSNIEATLRHEASLEAGLEVLGGLGQDRPNENRSDEGRPDVVVVSTGLPKSENASAGHPGSEGRPSSEGRSGSEGTDAVEAVVAAAPELPTVVLVGPEDTAVALQVQKAGVAEALRKENLSPPLLGRTLRWTLREEQMQRKLRQRDAWIRSITEGLSAGVFRAGPTGRIEYANEALVHLLGFEREDELIGRDLTDFYADPHQRGLMLAEEGASAAEITFRRKASKQEDRDEFTGLLSAKVASGPEGRPVHYDGTITDITERKEKEKKLRVLSEAVQQAKESVLITEAAPLDKPGPRIEYVNEAYEEMTGYSEEEVLGKTPRILQGPETDREVLDSLREALEAGEEWKGETINYRKGGEPYRVQWNVSPVTNDSGEIEHWVSVQRDVTEQRERERKLKQMAQALEQVADKVIITDREGQIQYVNGAFEEITGYREAEVLGESMRILQSGEHGEAFYEELSGTILSGETFRADFVNERKDGTQYVEDQLISPITGESLITGEEEEITHFVSTGRDVTERKEREEKLRRQKSLLEQTQKLAGAWEVDLEAGEVAWSEEVYRIHELDPEMEVSLDKGIEFYAPETREKARAVFEHCAQEGDSFDVELSIITAEGNRRHVRTVGAPSKTEGGKVIKAAGAVQDITERKEAGRKLRESRNHLRRTQKIGQVGGWEYDPESDTVSGTETLYDLLGLSSEDSLSLEEAFQFYPPEARETVQSAVHRCLQEGEPFDLRVPLVGAGGTDRWVRVRGAAEREEGKTVRLTGFLQDITDRERGRRELERYRTYTGRMLNAIGDLFYVIGGDGQLKQWNDSVPEVTGYSQEEIGDMTAFDLVPEEERGRVAAKMEECFEKGHGRMEVPLLRKDGTEVPYEVEGNLVGHPEGGTRMVIIGRDITDRRRREEHIERQNDLFRRAQEIASVGAWEYDAEAGTLTLTDQGYRVHGLSPEGEITPERSHGLFHPEDRPKAEEAFERAVEEGESYDIEARLTTEEGEKRWIRTRGEPQHGEDGEVARDGEVVRVRGTIQNITEKKRREQRLQKATERLRAAIEATPVPLLSLDLGGQVQLWNRAAERIFGWSKEEVRGHSLPIVPEEKQGEFATLRARFEEGERISGREIQRRAKDGTEMDLRLFAAPLCGAEGDVVGTMAALEDITEEKKRERELRAAKQEAEQANQLKSAFLAAMSHEIRTPLTSILGFAEAIGEEARGAGGEEARGAGGDGSAADLEALREFAGLIGRSGQRLMDTLTGVLNLSRLEAGEMDLASRPVGLAEQAEEIAEELRPQAEEKGLDFQVRGRGDSPIWAEADEGGVQIILRNLISNAIKYTQEGRAWVRVYRQEASQQEASQQEDSQKEGSQQEGSQKEGEVVIEVEDTGIGMDPSQVEALFEPFRQASEGISREYEGTGLGLAVAQEAAQQMGGSVEVETEKGEGSCFTVRLPRAEDS